MRFAILGAGAMGSTFGGYLEQDGHDVTLIDPWREHMSAVTRDGLVIEEADSGKRIVAHPVATSDAGSVKPVDTVILLAKGFATREAGESIRPAVGPETLVVTLQNGLGNDHVLAELFDASRVVPGTTTVGATVAGPGHVTVTPSTADHTSVTQIGRPRGLSEMPERVRIVAEALTHAGLPTEAIDDADVVIWTKLSVAGSMAPLAAALRRNIVEIIGSPDGLAILRTMVEEIVGLAQKEGVSLDLEEVWQHATHTWESVGAHYPSMAVDIMRARQTEIETFSLEIARRAKSHGGSAPYAECIGRLVKVLEATPEPT
jgi:2-dehydropantoate 2-reductase